MIKYLQISSVDHSKDPHNIKNKNKMIIESIIPHNHIFTPIKLYKNDATTTILTPVEDEYEWGGTWTGILWDGNNNSQFFVFQI